MGERYWIIIAKTTNLEDIPPLQRLWYAESNLPAECGSGNLRLSGNPEILEAVKIFLNALPPTYTKQDAGELMDRAIEEVYL